MPKNKSNQQKGGKGGNGSQKSKSGGKPGNSNAKQSKNVKVIEAIPNPTEKTELPQRGSNEALNDWTVEFDGSFCNLPSISSSNEKPIDTEYRSKDSFENSQSIDHQTEKDLSNSDTASRRNAESGDIVGPRSSSEQNNKRQAGDCSQNERRGDSCWDRSPNDTNDKSFENTKYKSPTDKNRTSSGSYQNRANDFGNASKYERRGDSCWDRLPNDTNNKSFENTKYKSPTEKNRTSSGSYQNSAKDFANSSQNERRRESRWDRSPNDPNRNNELNDKDYKGFWSHFKASRMIDYIKVQEIDGDLFAMPKEYSLAHCVAEDMSMGSGIAVQFSRDFKRRDELLQQRQKQGGLAILEIEQRFIYYLVTKRQSTGKPTMVTLWNSLQKLKVHVEEHKVTNLAIPRIGCGLDRLEWSEVKAMIEYIFRNTEIEITVCNFQQNYGKTKQKLKQKPDSVKNEKQTKIDDFFTGKGKKSKKGKNKGCK